jgi:hypothetical protein
MKLIAGTNKQRLLFIINRLLLALAVLVILAVLLYDPWRSELMREMQMVFINARLL